MIETTNCFSLFILKKNENLSWKTNLSPVFLVEGFVHVGESDISKNHSDWFKKTLHVWGRSTRSLFEIFLMVVNLSKVFKKSCALPKTKSRPWKWAFCPKRKGWSSPFATIFQRPTVSFQGGYLYYRWKTTPTGVIIWHQPKLHALFLGEIPQNWPIHLRIILIPPKWVPFNVPCPRGSSKTPCNRIWFQSIGILCSSHHFLDISVSTLVFQRPPEKVL